MSHQKSAVLAVPAAVMSKILDDYPEIKLKLAKGSAANIADQVLVKLREKPTRCRKCHTKAS